MTNPNNAIGTNGAYGGRTSVNAFNDNLAIFLGRGVLSGFAVSPDSGMSVVIGGDGTTRDVAIAEDNIGNKTTINNISESPVALTIAGAPASNSRIDAIVAYVDNPAQGSATETDNPSACGLIAVQGTVAATPSQPDENAIRTAITADGASGSTAYYVVLGYITVANGTTDITSEMIEQGAEVELLDDFIGNTSIKDGSITNSKIADNEITGSKIAGTTITNNNIADNTITLDKLKMPRITVAGVDGNQQSSVYKITFDPNVEPYTIFVGTVYVRHNMPSTFRITVGATTGVISNAVFTDSTNFSATTSGNTVTVTYTGGQWSMFYLAYMEYKATMGMTITR